MLVLVIISANIADNCDIPCSVVANVTNWPSRLLTARWCP